ncbi:MAG: hypothetical protein JWM33_2041, partial [Caulobacteraceae bacterium]|nr:hypothetical protein [Caulobacteraceae bacterium]
VNSTRHGGDGRSRHRQSARAANARLSRDKGHLVGPAPCPAVGLDKDIGRSGDIEELDIVIEDDRDLFAFGRMNHLIVITATAAGVDSPVPG